MKNGEKHEHDFHLHLPTGTMASIARVWLRLEKKVEMQKFVFTLILAILIYFNLHLFLSFTITFPILILSFTLFLLSDTSRLLSASLPRMYVRAYDSIKTFSILTFLTFPSSISKR